MKTTGLPVNTEFTENTKLKLSGERMDLVAKWMEQRFKVEKIDSDLAQQICMNLESSGSTSFDAPHLAACGMREEMLDFLVFHYCETQPDIFVLCLWPVAVKARQMDEVKRQIGHWPQIRILYEKECLITYHGLKNLQILAYGDEEWAGTLKTHYYGVESKTASCFADVPTHFFVLQGGTTEEILTMKDAVREIFGIEKNSVHSTDTQEEALNLLRVLLHGYSLQYLNKFQPYKNPEFVRLVTTVSQQPGEVFTPEFTLAALGKLKASKLDAYHAVMHPAGLLDCTYDDRNYFYFENKKFLRPRIAAKLDPIHSSAYKELCTANHIPKRDLLNAGFKRIFYATAPKVSALLKRLGLYQACLQLMQKVFWR